MLAVTGNRLTKGNAISIGVNKFRPLLIVRWGQSNQLGVEPMTSFPSKYLTPNTNIKVFKSNGVWVQWDNTQSGTGWNNTTGWGGDWNFVTLLQPYISKPIYIFKFAVGGTSIYTDWKVGGNTYNSAYGRLAQAVSNMNSMVGVGAWDMVFMWNQGETDSFDTTKSSVYESLLTSMVQSVTNNYTVKYMVFTKTAPEIVTGYPYVGVIRQAQDNIIAGYNNPKYITVETSGIHQGYQLHFDANGYEEVGLREFNALKAIL